MAPSPTVFVVLPEGGSGETPLLEALGGRADVVVGRTAADLAAVADRVEVIVTWNGGNPRPLLQEVGLPPTLRWIHHSGIGVDQFLFDDLVASEVVVTNIRGSGTYALTMAEYVLALMLMFARRLQEIADNQRRRAWERLPGSSLRGKTLGIVGLGAIGQAVAGPALALGMAVVATRRDTSKPAPHGVTVCSPDHLDRLLSTSDYVALCVPRTAETQSLIDAGRLRQMKRTAILINVGRGSLVDADALRASLCAGELGGAALDVFAREPLPADDELWATPNLFVSPHMSAFVEGPVSEVVDVFLDNYARWLDGRPLLRIVDKGRGY